MIPILNEKQVLDNLKALKNSYLDEYYAFYSSWFGGIIKDPHLMLIPIDDHMVHRGDAVFEAAKAKSRSVYLLDQHLQRLFNSAAKLSLKLPFDHHRMKEIILETLKVADKSEVILRIYLSRGPGNFSVNPYDSIASQFYVVITQLKSLAAEKYESGVSLGKSKIPVKSSWMAQVKSCNYLPNVLMKKEAVDRGFDYVIGTDEQGYITESATENIMIVDKNGIIVHPMYDYILKGITMTRVCELAREKGISTEIRPIEIEDLQSAREVMLASTTSDILPVVKFEDHKIANGKPGPVTKELQKLLLDDMKSGNCGVAF